jgi:hypothetical protein
MNNFAEHVKTQLHENKKFHLGRVSTHSTFALSSTKKNYEITNNSLLSKVFERLTHLR